MVNVFFFWGDILKTGGLPEMLQFCLVCILRIQLSPLLKDNSFLLSIDLAQFYFISPESFQTKKHQAFLHWETTWSCFMRNENDFVINVPRTKIFLKYLKGTHLLVHTSTLRIHPFRSYILCDVKKKKTFLKEIVLKGVSILIHNRSSQPITQRHQQSVIES